MGRGAGRFRAAGVSSEIAKTTNAIFQSISGLTGRLRAQNAGRRVARGGGGVLGANGLLWDEGRGDLC